MATALTANTRSFFHLTVHKLQVSGIESSIPPIFIFRWNDRLYKNGIWFTILNCLLSHLLQIVDVVYEVLHSLLPGNRTMTRNKLVYQSICIEIFKVLFPAVSIAITQPWMSLNK